MVARPACDVWIVGHVQLLQVVSIMESNVSTVKMLVLT
jgi:hypothetical protein